MKYIWSVTCLLLLGLSSYADPVERITEKSNQEQERSALNQDHDSNSYQEASGESQTSEETENSEELESDSSYYSVNKFNFLFYLVYKIKYTDDGMPVEEQNAVMIEE